MQFQFSKEYSDEEACIFQLISNKKNDFLNFFVDFFMDLPGFMTIYKDKFFSRIKDFIDDNNYILALKEKFNKKCDENKNYIKNEDNNELLGLKRKRIEENILSAYAKELKLLENDYPQIIENNEEFNFDNVKIKKEKIDDDINCADNTIKKEKSISIKKEKKEILHSKIEHYSNDNNENEINEDFPAVNKSKKKISIKFTSKKKQANKNNNSTSNKNSKTRRGKVKNKSITKSQLYGIFTPLKNFQVNNFVNNVFDNSIYGNNYSISVMKETSKSINSFYGINSRFDKTPKINIYRKKNNQINHSAKRLMDNIKNRLSVMEKNNVNLTKKRNLSDDRKMMEEMQNLNQIVNSNFYGKERQKFPNYAKNEENNNIACLNDENVINNQKKKKIEKINNKKTQAKIDYNKNVSIKYNIILTCGGKKGGKKITKSEFIPYSIIKEKSALSIKEVKSIYESVFEKDKLSKKDNENIKNQKEKNQKRIKKLPKKKIIKSIPHMKQRKSERIQKLNKIKEKKEIAAQSLIYKRKLRKRKRKQFITVKKSKEVQRHQKNNNKTKKENKAKKENEEKKIDKIKKDNKANKEDKSKKDNKLKKENGMKKDNKPKKEDKAQKVKKDEKLKKEGNKKTKNNNKAAKEYKIKNVKKRMKSEEKRFDSLGQSSLLNMDNIRTNKELLGVDEDSNIKINEDEILVKKTKCDDYFSDEERLTSNRMRRKINNCINNSILNDNLGEFNTLNDYNYLFNQKK